MSLRREIKAGIKTQHDLYVNNLVGVVKINPRAFYRYISSQTKDRQGIPPLKKKGGNGVTELEKAEELIGQFNGAFNKTEYNEVLLTRRSAPFMDVLWCLQME